jgi:dihydrofolate reductase
MGTLMVDFITSLDGYGAAEGWPGWWGMESPEYLGWLGEQPEYTVLMGATTYRLMAEFAASGEEGVDQMLTPLPKVVFSSTLTEPLAWANTRLVTGDAVEAVGAMKEDSRIYDGYPDIRLDLVESRTFDGGLQLLEYVPTVLDGPPGTTGAAS